MNKKRQELPMTGMRRVSSTPPALDRPTMARLGQVFEAHQRDLETWVAHVLLAGSCPEESTPPPRGPEALAQWLAEIDGEGIAEEALVAETRDCCTALRRAAEKVEASAGECAATRAFLDAELALRRRVQVLRERLAGAWVFTDPLTGVYRRELMEPVLQREQARVDRGRSRCCVAMLDLDHFKQVNDRYGHGVGDLVLRRAAEEMQRHARQYDWVFRYGGEEFLICLPRINHRQAGQAMDRIRRSVGGAVCPAGDEGPERVTISIGLAELRPGETPDDAVECADRALYEAKAAGRNRVVSRVGTRGRGGR